MCKMPPLKNSPPRDPRDPCGLHHDETLPERGTGSDGVNGMDGGKRRSFPRSLQPPSRLTKLSIQRGLNNSLTGSSNGSLNNSSTSSLSFGSGSPRNSPRNQRHRILQPLFFTAVALYFLLTISVLYTHWFTGTFDEYYQQYEGRFLSRVNDGRNGGNARNARNAQHLLPNRQRNLRNSKPHLPSDANSPIPPVQLPLLGHDDDTLWYSDFSFNDLSFHHECHYHNSNPDKLVYTEEMWRFMEEVFYRVLSKEEREGWGREVEMSGGSKKKNKKRQLEYTSEGRTGNPMAVEMQRYQQDLQGGGGAFHPPFIGKHSPGKGRGAFATRDIQKGELVTPRSSIVIFRDGDQFRKYIMALPRKYACDMLEWSWIQPIGKEDNLKICTAFHDAVLMNSVPLGLGRGEGSGNFNVARRVDTEPEYYATKDIKKGEELLENYGQYTTPWERFGLADVVREEKNSGEGGREGDVDGNVQRKRRRKKRRNKMKKDGDDAGEGEESWDEEGDDEEYEEEEYEAEE